MPEGDTLFRAARTLHRALAGKKVARFESAYAHVTGVAVDNPVVGRTVDSVRAVGKHLLVCFSGGLVLRTHMLMSGSWHIYRAGERWQRRDMRVLVATDDFVAVGFDIPVAALESAEATERELRRLGPDLLSPTFDEDEALRRLRAHPAEEIAEALVDQSVVAGAGNIFKCETLFVARVSPFRRVDALDDDTLRTIIATARRLLAANVRPGARAGIATTGRSAPGESRWVYDRAGKPCRRCGATIALARQGPHVRLTYYCPTCQSV
jgi:endonuclease VIII